MAKRQKEPPKQDNLPEVIKPEVLIPEVMPETPLPVIKMGDVAISTTDAIASIRPMLSETDRKAGFDENSIAEFVACVQELDALSAAGRQAAQILKKASITAGAKLEHLERTGLWVIDKDAKGARFKDFGTWIKARYGYSVQRAQAIIAAWRDDQIIAPMLIDRGLSMLPTGELQYRRMRALVYEPVRKAAMENLIEKDAKPAEVAAQIALAEEIARNAVADSWQKAVEKGKEDKKTENVPDSFLTDFLPSVTTKVLKDRFNIEPKPVETAASKAADAEKKVIVAISVALRKCGVRNTDANLIPVKDNPLNNFQRMVVEIEKAGKGEAFGDCDALLPDQRVKLASTCTQLADALVLIATAVKTWGGVDKVAGNVTKVEPVPADPELAQHAFKN